ncbi:hypothetical protein [Nitrosomonas communis]|uniref:Uncharacterized protein n=1 Tax=Nitrosomonas communis TaxID=44574 RepID=A0A1I4W286_9PROT|nr:hypothetical protein [Nitrosomonas communis]SFN07575.1 hypothetical protein SAMN05421863_109611 [Nitrosomonas communis]
MNEAAHGNLKERLKLYAMHRKEKRHIQMHNRYLKLQKSDNKSALRHFQFTAALVRLISDQRSSSKIKAGLIVGDRKASNSRNDEQIKRGPVSREDNPPGYKGL